MNKCNISLGTFVFEMDSILNYTRVYLLGEI